MKATFDRAKVILDGEDAFLCLAVPYRDAKKFVGEMKQKKYAVEIKEYRPKRSLDANAYLWALLDRLAEALGTTKEELYRLYVKQYGLFRDFSLDSDEVNTFCHAWGMIGTGWITEPVDYTEDGERQVIRAYYGTSTYNSRQFTRILNAVIDECKMQGIETLTPDELARMMADRR